MGYDNHAWVTTTTRCLDNLGPQWVQDGSPAHSSTPVKIDTLQFVPKNTNPKEFKALQQQIKENRRADKISAGPQSHILEGVTWDEASKLIGEDAANTHTGDHVVLMGAASKGIIQRGYQHNATVYSAPYARNPFDHVTDTDIDEYRRTVERKQRSDYDTDLSESEAISAAQMTSPIDTEEESRDEHRVLRIETKQAPVRSQPEVVLSDADTTDFLAAERAHADRTKGPPRDPNLLSDDEVFYDSPASPMTSEVMSPVPRVVIRAAARQPTVLSDDDVFLPPASVTVRSHVAPAPQTVGHVGQPVGQPVGQAGQTISRGKVDEKEALSSNKRTKHEYSRSTNFDNIVKQYDSPKQVPKCKTNLTARLGHTHEAGNESSRSSLYSIPSIEWDGRCKSDFGLRSRSLPRNRTARLFRTQSHSGFINSYMKDPEPTHYHVPRCRSCGASNVSYAFELSKEDKTKKAKNHPSIYYSVDNIPQKCSEEVARDPTYVKVHEKFVPVFKVEKKDVEFVESQEFNEDNYIGDIGNSFSSENQTVIEKSDANDQTVQISEKNAQISTKSTIKDDKETLTRDLEEDDGIEDVNKTLESIEGEYHSFTDLEDSYESPVKELVEKDIRDYSVPIDFYCEDFKAKEEVKKSPLKVKNTLEPILEESKSSYGDDSNTSQNDKKEEVVENIVGDVVNIAVLASQLKQEISTIATQKVTPEALVAECVSRQESYLVNEEGSDITANDVESFTTNVVQTAVDIYENEASEQDMLDSVYDNVFEILSNENESEVNEVKRQNSLASTLSSTERISMDSTAEFEKYEVVSEILSCILSRIEFVEIVLKVKTPKVELLEHFNTDDDIQETFSIAKMIADIEQTVCLNETVLTEVSDTDIGQTNKIIEGIIYYIFDRAMFINNQKLKSNKKTVKKVITVAEFEDILFTAKPIWMDSEDYEEIPLEEKQSVEKDFYAIKDFFNAKCLQSAVEQNEIKTIKEKRCDCEVAAKVDDDVGMVNSHENSCQCEDHVDDSSEHKEQVDDKPQENGNVLDDDNQVYIDPIVNNIEVIEEKTDYCKQVAIYHEYKNLTYILDKPTFSDLDTTNFNLEPQVDNNITTNDASKTADMELNETFVETSDMNNAFHEDFSQSEDATISSQTEECFVTPDVDLTSELKENISLETDTYVIETVIDTSQEEYHSTVNDEFKDISDRTEEFASFSVQSSTNNIEEYLSPIRDQSLEDTIFSPEYRDISLITNNVKEETKKKESSRKRKHVKEAQSRSSSPNRKTTKQFELNESPIKSDGKATPLKNLAKRRAYSDIASPFIKKTHVLAMSQTEHSGGVKYWLSFDENLPVVETEKVARNVKSIDDTLPSFISIDIDEDSMEGNPKKFFDKATSMNTKRSSVLLHEYNENDVSFPSPSTSNIEFARERVREIVADPELERDDTDKDLPQKKLLYELHSRPSKRLYSSWPPFEDTLFYRIISKFRMSESFDPNDLEDPNFDSSA